MLSARLNQFLYIVFIHMYNARQKHGPYRSKHVPTPVQCMSEWFSHTFLVTEVISDLTSGHLTMTGSSVLLLNQCIGQCARQCARHSGSQYYIAISCLPCLTYINYSGGALTYMSNTGMCRGKDPLFWT